MHPPIVLWGSIYVIRLSLLIILFKIYLSLLIFSSIWPIHYWVSELYFPLWWGISTSLCSSINFWFHIFWSYIIKDIKLLNYYKHPLVNLCIWYYVYICKYTYVYKYTHTHICACGSQLPKSPLLPLPSYSHSVYSFHIVWGSVCVTNRIEQRWCYVAYKIKL